MKDSHRDPRLPICWGAGQPGSIGEPISWGAHLFACQLGSSAACPASCSGSPESPGSLPGGLWRKPREAGRLPGGLLGSLRAQDPARGMPGSWKAQGSGWAGELAGEQASRLLGRSACLVPIGSFNRIDTFLWNVLNQHFLMQLFHWKIFNRLGRSVLFWFHHLA